MRHATSNGTYDIYTNQMHYPANTQPTHAKFEAVPLAKKFLGDVSGHQESANNENKDPKDGTNDELAKVEGRSDTIFPPVSKYQYNNYMTIDYITQIPDISQPPPPGPTHFPGYRPVGGTIDDIQEDLIELLPPDCLRSFLEAREKTRAWKQKWATEVMDGARVEPKISYSSI